MFGAPLVRATIMQQQRRPNVSNLPTSSAIRTTVMANLASQSQHGSNEPNGQIVNIQSEAAATKPASKYVDVDPQMFIDSPFVGGATLSPATSHESTASHARGPGKGKNGSFSLKFFNPSDDPRLFAM
ncbi:unnamed protein product [Rhizoctonia solani]|uniref:Uncharacterized protein n=1 Tax=Rhizoctonia solani TaxID=456999 RepID=A0A8H3AY21_9AGAM|nr:unnamed protein product [Rhizoctonia solani]